MKKAISIDLETIADPSIIDHLADPDPDARLKDPIKIRADIEKKRTDQIAKCVFKPNKNLIVCAGWYDGNESGSFYLPLGGSERELLVEYWNHLSKYDYFYSFNGIAYDVPTMNIHSIRHRLRPPIKIDTRRYSIGNHLDCYAVLSHWDMRMGGGLDYYMKYFGLSSGKEGMSGDQVAGFYESGSGEQVIRDYCEKDCKDTWLLAKHVEKYMI